MLASGIRLCEAAEPAPEMSGMPNAMTADSRHAELMTV
jgi:hypothetical protein